MDVDVEKSFRATYHVSPPYVINNGNGELYGYMIKFLNVLKRVDNITFTFIPSTDSNNGFEVGSSWNGLLGVLKRNEADFSIIPSTIYNERLNAFATSHPFLVSRTHILFGAHQKNEWDFYSVIDKWIIVAFVGLALLIYMIGKVISKYGKVKSELPGMLLLQCLLGTSPQSVKCDGVARFLSVTWSLTSFILLIFVSSEMTSEFSTKTVTVPFDVMEDIFKFPNARPLLKKDGSLNVNFLSKNALTSAAYAEVFKRVEANPNSCYVKKSNMHSDILHSQIESREKFFILSDMSNWNIIKARYAKTRNCKMKLSKPLMIAFRSMYFKKNISQTLIKVINKRLRQLTEGDCLEDLNPSLKLKLHPCQRSETPEAFVVINVLAFIVIFRVFVLGFSASFITLILQIVVKKMPIIFKN